MPKTITKRLFFTSLDARLHPCSAQNAIYQLEKYRACSENVYAIAPYVGKFSYSIGQSVDTMPLPRIELSDGIALINVIKNACLLNTVSKNRII